MHIPFRAIGSSFSILSWLVLNAASIETVSAHPQAAAMATEGPQSVSAKAVRMRLQPANTSRAEASQSCESWSVKSGSDTLLYPDTHSTYISYKFLADAGTALRITGEFAHVRFQSFTLYDDETGALVNKLQDEAISADQGSVNPFQVGVDHSANNRNYTLWIAPEGSLHSAEANVIPVPTGLRTLTLMMRLYAPESGVDALGGVSLPTVVAVDAMGTETISCPGTHSGWYMSSEDSAPPQTVQTDVHFFRMLGSQYYPSYDTAYLATLLDPSLGRVVVLKYNPPIVPNTSSGTGAFTGRENMRYWSMCLSNQSTTTTAACLADSETHISDDGMVYLVLTRPDSKVAIEAAKAGMNVLAWPTTVRSPVLLYRNILVNGGFPFGNNAVPPFDATVPASQQVAELFIGSYAPVGIHCSERQFLQNHCGIGP